MRRIAIGLGVAVLAAGGTPLAGAQGAAAGTLRIAVPAVPGPVPAAPDATPSLGGLKLRLVGATRADYGPFALASRGTEDVDLPAGSYVAFGARLRKAACPDVPFEVKAGRRVTLAFESGAPAGGAPVCAVRVTAGP